MTYWHASGFDTRGINNKKAVEAKVQGYLYGNYGLAELLTSSIDAGEEDGLINAMLMIALSPWHLDQYPQVGRSTFIRVMYCYKCGCYVTGGQEDAYWVHAGHIKDMVEISFLIHDMK